MTSRPVMKKSLLIVLAVAMLAGMAALIYFKADQIREVKEQLLVEKIGLQQDKERLAGLEALKTKKEILKEEYLRVERLIPEEPSEDSLIRHIQQKASDAGLEFAEIKFDIRQQQELYIDMPIDVAMTGDYYELVAFLKGIYKGERAVRIDTIHFSAISDGTNNVRADIRAHSFSRK